MMRRYNLENLPPIIVPEGCGLRTYREGDEEAWGKIMDTGVGNEWTARKVRENLVERPQFAPDGLFFATIDDKPVGSACAWKSSPEEKRMGTVHMVCVLPETRGKRLGHLVTLAVLHYFRDHGFKESVLTTDDFRVPAIKTYLSLGFEPFLRDLTQVYRWSQILSRFNT